MIVQRSVQPGAIDIFYPEKHYEDEMAWNVDVECQTAISKSRNMHFKTDPTTESAVPDITPYLTKEMYAQ